MVSVQASVLYPGWSRDRICKCFVIQMPHLVTCLVVEALHITDHNLFVCLFVYCTVFISILTQMQPCRQPVIRLLAVSKRETAKPWWVTVKELYAGSWDFGVSGTSNVMYFAALVSPQWWWWLFTETMSSLFGAVKAEAAVMSDESRAPPPGCPMHWDTKKGD